MIHLGISYGHNATVAVIADGKLIFCQSEERLDPTKNSTGFPHQTLAHLYRHICPPGEGASCSLFLANNLGYLILKQGGYRLPASISPVRGHEVDAWGADPAAA